MDTADATEPSLKSKLTMAALIIANAAVVAFLHGKTPSVAPIYGGSTLYKLTLVTPLALLIAVRLVFWRSRAGYMIAILSALPPAIWLCCTETHYFRFGLNSWIALNRSGSDPETLRLMHYTELRIVLLFLLLLLLFTATLRLLPGRWTFLGKPLALRTWPAFAVSLTCIVVWFAVSVTPYREPVIVDSVSPELSILHVERDGFSFHETAVNFYRGDYFTVVRTDRILFRYSFDSQIGRGAMNLGDGGKLQAAAKFAKADILASNTPERLRARKGEAWYVQSRQYPISTFSTESSRNRPPNEIIELLQSVEQAQSRPWRPHVMRDVCLGFCYDPRAGLGQRFVNQRCSEDTNGNMRCL